MSSESQIDLLLFDGSNYMSWCNCMLSLLNAIDPVLVSITNASIYPPNFSRYDDVVVTTAFCFNDLYLLSLYESVNAICDDVNVNSTSNDANCTSDNVNDKDKEFSLTKESKKRKRIPNVSSKL